MISIKAASAAPGCRKVLRVLAVCLLLSACSRGLDGTYSDELGMTEYSFRPDGKAYVSVLGIITELEYEIDGDKLKLTGKDGDQILTLLDDDTITGPLGIRLRRKADSSE